MRKHEHFGNAMHTAGMYTSLIRVHMCMAVYNVLSTLSRHRMKNRYYEY